MPPEFSVTSSSLCPGRKTLESHSLFAIPCPTSSQLSGALSSFPKPLLPLPAHFSITICPYSGFIISCLNYCLVGLHALIPTPDPMNSPLSNESSHVRYYIIAHGIQFSRSETPVLLIWPQMASQLYRPLFLSGTLSFCQPEHACVSPLPFFYI